MSDTPTAQAPMLDLASLFARSGAAGAAAFGRRRDEAADGMVLIHDTLGAGLPSCVTVLAPGARGFRVPAGYALSAAPGGGFLLTAAGAQHPGYWLPLTPRLVWHDANGRLLRVAAAPVAGLDVSTDGLSVQFDAGTAVLEAVVWRLPAGQLQAGRLPAPVGLEQAAWYTLGSHTVVRGGVDVYRHLVGGRVFETRPAWPNAWRVFSENDGHALHLVLGGLAAASPGAMLGPLRQQVLLSVLERQGSDGGFHHGEWTQLMESHYRLHCSAMHLMMDALDEAPQPMVAAALRKAAAFMAAQSVRLQFGQWLLHDELEHSVANMRLGPFKWVASQAFGKTESNMLVLNSHLDAVIALDRYAHVTGDAQFAPLVASARQSTTAVLQLRAATPLYRVVFWLIDLTFLPTPQAAALPVWKRLLKRLTWKYLIPRLPDIKARFPRLVMPGGYIDRELSLRTWAHDYHAINLMDLARYLRRFDDPVVRQVLLDGLDFTRRSGLLQRWREMDYQKYALGFWAEALYHVCTLLPDAKYRAWLAEAMQTLEDLQMGLPPSLLGANAEAVPVAAQMPCPSPADARLRVANLGRQGAPELLVLNPSNDPIALHWASPPPAGLAWRRADGSALVGESTLAARSWVWAGAGG